MSRNPIQVFGAQQNDETPGVQPSTKVLLNEPEPFWLSVTWAPGGEIEGYFTTDFIENAREEGRFGSIMFALDRLSVHLDARFGTRLISENDRYVFNSTMLEVRQDVTRFVGFRASMESEDESYLVGIAEPLASLFFERLRDSVDWLRE